METLGDLCTHMKVLKLEAALLGILYTMCGTAATPTTGKYLARFTVPEGKQPRWLKQGGNGLLASLLHVGFSSQPKFTLWKLLGPSDSNHLTYPIALLPSTLPSDIIAAQGWAAHKREAGSNIGRGVRTGGTRRWSFPNDSSPPCSVLFSLHLHGFPGS